ncbi:hypothetical protein BamIOP4010DRAFT_2694 [Burkholderia ambifaria IOP40-10]|uniref:Uncharacterized protein n=1 Tax=Burkholderia ambifaria IOP40-10 TaxID=396596 RepID=B1FF84_9BURK|nr:hypothetical protein BamIOP4010DRAFT_2694 [Burkholderia ambifaria IOP40-10]
MVAPAVDAANADESYVAIEVWVPVIESGVLTLCVLPPSDSSGWFGLPDTIDVLPIGASV